MNETVKFYLQNTSAVKIILRSLNDTIELYNGKVSKGYNKLNIITDRFSGGTYQIQIINEETNKTVRTDILEIKETQIHEK